MNLITAMEYLRDEMDPDEIVDYLGIDSADLVEALADYIADWLEVNKEED
jgi:acyl carrier protein